jgi:hypothetical protein
VPASLRVMVHFLIVGFSYGFSVPMDVESPTRWVTSEFGRNVISFLSHSEVMLLVSVAHNLLFAGYKQELRRKLVSCPSLPSSTSPSSSDIL